MLFSSEGLLYALLYMIYFSEMPSQMGVAQIFLKL